MIPRKPGIHPERGIVNWSPVAEFSSFLNGVSVVAPHFEYFVCKVMKEIRDNHCANNPKLKEELDLFIAQESQHAQYHVKFNHMMYDAGFESIKKVEKAISGAFRRIRKEESLEYNAAIAAGAETLATFQCRYFFEDCDHYLIGSDIQGANLWLWHLAEEWEHRSVAHDAYDHISGNYLLRARALFDAFTLIGGAFKQAEAEIMSVVRESLSDEERRASEKRSKQVFRRQLIYTGPQMLRTFLPWYHPSRLKDPPNIQNALSVFEREEEIDQLFDIQNRSKAA